MEETVTNLRAIANSDPASDQVILDVLNRAQSRARKHRCKSISIVMEMQDGSYINDDSFPGEP